MSERAPKVLVHPIITEKSTDLASRGSYVFRVKKNAGKTEIKKAVEELYHVDVTRVNVINIPAKERFLRGVYGKKKGYKKAIVTIREGQEISFV